LGDSQKGFRLVYADGEFTGENEYFISGDDAIVCYLHNESYFYSKDEDADLDRQSIAKKQEAFLLENNIVLMVPLKLGEHCAGLIGLGPETTGDRYGHDDFDLLLALSSQAASALLAVQNAEKLARSREQSAYSNLSAFVLHDIKNAATMLKLVRANASEHMDNPEFQQDMLETIDDALIRMGKVQDRLYALKSEVGPELKQIDLGGLVRSCINKLMKKLPDLVINLQCPPELSVRIDQEFISQILENMVINSREAGGSGTVVRISVKKTDSKFRIEIQDNGPGIQADLLPLALFEPFKTNKSNGSGIGLWQVQQLVEGLGGAIQARNTTEGGAHFILRFPISPGDLRI
jgi:putative PEP-CTERM system histidine kinase